MQEVIEETRHYTRVDPWLRRRNAALAALEASAEDRPKGSLDRFFGGLVLGHWHAVDAFRAARHQVTLWRRSSTETRPRRRLSQREIQVANRVVQGKPNKLIAADLGVRETTVSTHLHTVLSKLNMPNRSTLVASVPMQAFPLQDEQAGPTRDARPGSSDAIAEVIPLRPDGEPLLVLGVEHRWQESSSHLTASEQAVATLLAAGLSYRAIARTRGASPNTIKNQSSAIYHKLDIHSRFELTSLWWGPRL